MLAFCSLLLPSYYAKNYAGKIGTSLFIASHTEFEIAVSHWPFFDQFQDLADQKTDMLEKIYCTFPMGNLIRAVQYYRYYPVS